MKAVFDTNVIVSGLLSPHSHPGAIVRLIAANRVQACLDARIFAEYAEVLARPKFKFDPRLVAMLLDYIKHSGEFTSCEPSLAALPDEDDRMFYEVALAAKADCLVTGNERHFPRAACKKVKVLNPAQFTEFYSSLRKDD